MAAALIQSNLTLLRSISALFRNTCSINSNPRSEKPNIQPNRMIVGISKPKNDTKSSLKPKVTNDNNNKVPMLSGDSGLAI